MTDINFYLYVCSYYHVEYAVLTTGKFPRMVSKLCKQANSCKNSTTAVWHDRLVYQLKQHVIPLTRKADIRGTKESTIAAKRVNLSKEVKYIELI